MPLAICLSKKFIVKGFDTDEIRINNLNKGYDRTLEFSKKELLTNKNVFFSNNIENLKSCNFL